jgi:hypothetical protein
MNLQAELERLKPSVEPSPWRGREHVRGYGVFGLPLSSGHTLALRVFPVNDFAPYVTVWHRDPGGDWSIHYQAARPDIACPRYYGPAARHVTPASIELSWDGAAQLTIRVDRPRLEWTIWMRETPVLRLLNQVSRRLPLWTWQYPPLLKPREWMARRLGMGVIKLAGPMPSGHVGVLMPQRIYLIDRAHARLEGVDLGTPTRLHTNPTIGDVTLPARGIFAIGQAHWEIRDPAEYRRVRAELAGASPGHRAGGAAKEVPIA